jgi:hypothetical protein
MDDRIGRNQYTQLPPSVAPTDFVVEVPAFEDDRPAPPPIPPAAAPELVAATEFARGAGGPRTIRRTQIPAALLIAGVPIGAVVVIAAVQILFTP